MPENHPDIPKEMRAMVIESSGQMPVLKTVPVPTDIGPEDVLIKIAYSGVCHTDLHAAKNDFPMKADLPLIGGHEGVGQVVRRGNAVKSIEIGDWVGVKWINSTCMSCNFCEAAEEELCQKAKMSGFTVPGTFSEYTVSQAATVARIPKEALPVKPEIAPVLCAGLTVYKGLKQSGAKPGQTVAIVGAGGGLGSLAVQYAKAMGLRPIAVDTGSEKEKACKKGGAEAFIDFKNPGDDGLAKAVQKAAGGDGLGPHAVLLVAANDKPFQEAIDYIRPRGTIVCIGIPPDSYFKAPIFSTVLKMITVKGSYVGSRQDTTEALDFYARGLLSVPCKVVGLKDLPDVYEKLDKGEVTGRYVIDMSK